MTPSIRVYKTKVPCVDKYINLRKIFLSTGMTLIVSLSGTLVNNDITSKLTMMSFFEYETCFRLIKCAVNLSK